MAKLNLFLSDAYRLRYIALFVVYDRQIANYATVDGNVSSYSIHRRDLTGERKFCRLRPRSAEREVLDARKGGDCNYNWDDIFKNPYNEANLRVDLTTALYVNRWEKARVRDRLVGIRESLWECCACVEP